MTYTIPNTNCEVHRVLPGVHVSPESAYVVDDYPYGFRLRCSIRYWIEYKPRRGFRFWSQTTNPKIVGRVVWNKAKAGVYHRFGAAMFLDQNNHVQHTGMGEYDSTAQCVEWREHFIDGVPLEGRKITEAWVKAKLNYDAKKQCDMDRA